MRRDADPRHWKLAIFYYNPDCSRVVVPKRWGLGWTFNFARPGVLAIGMMLVAASVYFAIANN